MSCQDKCKQGRHACPMPRICCSESIDMKSTALVGLVLILLVASVGFILGMIYEAL